MILSKSYAGGKKELFKTKFIKRKKVSAAKLLEKKPSEYLLYDISIRGHSIMNDFYVDGKKFEFYTLCD